MSPCLAAQVASLISSCELLLIKVYMKKQTCTFIGNSIEVNDTSFFP